MIQATQTAPEPEYTKRKNEYCFIPGCTQIVRSDGEAVCGYKEIERDGIRSLICRRHAKRHRIERKWTVVKTVYPG